MRGTRASRRPCESRLRVHELRFVVQQRRLDLVQTTGTLLALRLLVDPEAAIRRTRRLAPPTIPAPELHEINFGIGEIASGRHEIDHLDEALVYDAGRDTGRR